MSGVGNMARDVESKLTENEERNDKKEPFPTSMRDELHKILQLLTQSREEAQNGMVSIGRKLNGSEDNIKAEVLTSAIALIQNYAGREWKGEG